MKKSVVIILVTAVLLATALIGATVVYRNYAENAQAESESVNRNKEKKKQKEDEVEPKKRERDPDAELAPDFTMQTVDGRAVSLSDLYGKPVILNFWATWCPPCREEMPYFQSAYEEYGSEITFVMVNLTDGTSDTPEVVAEFIADNGYTFPVYCDVYYEGYTEYGIQYIPMTYVLDEEGYILAENTGGLTEQALGDYIDLLLN